MAGIWIAIARVFAGVLLCITNIGIPLGIASFKMAGLALFPLGMRIVSIDAVQTWPERRVTQEASRCSPLIHDSRWHYIDSI